MTPPEAKAWLIQQIVAEAERTSIELDSVEAGMLEYSETARTPANLEELNEAFDRAHDQDAYEEKIAALIRRMLAEWRTSNNSKLARWHDSVLALSNEDHYLLVMIAAADYTKPATANSTVKYSLLKLFLVAVAVTIGITLLLGYLATRTR